MNTGIITALADTATKGEIKIEVNGVFIRPMRCHFHVPTVEEVIATAGEYIKLFVSDLGRDPWINIYNNEDELIATTEY